VAGFAVVVTNPLVGPLPATDDFVNPLARNEIPGAGAEVSDDLSTGRGAASAINWWLCEGMSEFTIITLSEPPFSPWTYGDKPGADPELYNVTPAMLGS